MRPRGAAAQPERDSGRTQLPRRNSSDRGPGPFEGPGTGPNAIPLHPAMPHQRWPHDQRPSDQAVLRREPRPPPGEPSSGHA
eukprot:13418776-Heterocapsa_arctica.AAC.1